MIGKLALLLSAMSATEGLAMRDHTLCSSPPRFFRQSVPRPMRRGWPRLRGIHYSDVPPVLKRGKRRTLALKLAQVVNWHDERANLYGCHPCPKCGEVRHRSAIKWASGNVIECGACGDKRPIREWIG